MTPEATAAAVKDAFSTLGGGFMLSAQAKAKGKELGTGGWGLYMVGRGGVLGDADPSVVTAALHFFPYERVREGWERGRSVVPPAEGVPAFAAVCHEWGRAHLGDVPGLDKLAEVLPRVIAAADVAGKPLFAGWAAVPLPDDLPALVTQLCHVLREFRMACHGIAVAASELTPLEAVLAGGGAGNAGFFGWPEPYADASALVPRREQAEALTNTLAAAPWAALEEAERIETSLLLNTAREAALASLTAAG